VTAVATSLRVKVRERATFVRSSTTHIPSLDSLRAASFFLVFASHAGLDNVVPGGFGVAIFFFLSGFLITTLMLVEAEKTGHVSLKNFYVRRALRILPPFCIVLLGATALTAAGFLDGDLQPRAVASQILHFSNYWIAKHGYSGVASGTGGDFVHAVPRAPHGSQGRSAALAAHGHSACPRGIALVDRPSGFDVRARGDAVRTDSQANVSLALGVRQDAGPANPCTIVGMARLAQCQEFAECLAEGRLALGAAERHRDGER
jgi:hypothetical protein